MGYYNFSSSPVSAPISVGMVRHPVDRVISWYQYIRWHDRPDEKMPTVCNSTAKWRNFCDSMLAYRRNEKILHQKDVDFETCYRLVAWCLYNSERYTFVLRYRTGMSECKFEEGHGGWDDWLVTRIGGQKLHISKKPIYEDYRSQLFFFCDGDNGPDCLAFNSREALHRAKRTAEEKFAVVGVLDRLDDTMTALEGYVPRFFKGMKRLYKYQMNNGGRSHHAFCARLTI